VNKFHKLIVEPRRTASVEIDCEFLLESKPSIFDVSPRSIAISLLYQRGIEIDRHFMIGINCDNSWRQLLKSPEFRQAPNDIKTARISTRNQIFLGTGLQ
jgi:hypothetical protein